MPDRCTPFRHLALSLLLAPASVALAWEAPLPDASEQAEDEGLLLLGMELSRAPAASFAPWLDDSSTERRLQAVRALGRSRDPDAVLSLDPLLTDGDPALRGAVAFALGQHQGTAELLVSALGTETQPRVRATLLESLGRVGSQEHLPLLLDAIDGDCEHQATAASHALGRMGVRGEVSAPDPETVELLLRQLRRVELDRRRGAAFALARTKPSGLAAPAARRLAQAVQDQADPIARAWLVRAAATALEGPTWDQASAAAGSDGAQGVRVALARGLAVRGDASAAKQLSALLADEDRAVRVAALSAARSLPWDDAWDAPMQSMLDLHDPDLQARALPVLAANGRLAEAEGWLNPTVDPGIRAAMMSSVDEVERLLAWARDDSSPPVRTAATERLLELEPDPSLLLPLISGSDPVVAGLVAQTLAEAPDDALLDAISTALVRRNDYDGLLAMIEALAIGLEASGVAPEPGPPPLPGSQRAQVRMRVAELQRHDDPALRQSAGRLAALLGLAPAGAAAHPPLIETRALGSLVGAKVRTTQGEFVLAFHSEEAPYAVQRWAELAERGYFDDLVFHRIVPDFVAQVGCPRGDGYGGPGYALPDEFSALPYDAWAVGMATSGPDTAGSQWFVTLSPQPHLDGDYTLFGEVVLGQDTLRQLRQGDRIETVLIDRTPAAPTSHP
jgi:cyclophilin family peptidyl-prolyl cis-trans isomerase/HEAT repeat protein